MKSLCDFPSCANFANEVVLPKETRTHQRAMELSLFVCSQHITKAKEKLLKEGNK